MEPDKCDDLGWFPIDSPPDKVIDYIKIVIRCVQEGLTYSDFGW